MRTAFSRLISSTPEKRNGVDGFALKWPDKQPSPDWMSVADFNALQRAHDALEQAAPFTG